MHRSDRISTGLCVWALAVSLPAVAADRLDDLDGPMQGFDSLADVAPAIARLPKPRGGGEPDTLPDPDAVAVEELALDAVGEQKRARDGAFASELERKVSEGFVVDRDFEPADTGASLLVPAEDHFHEEEGEDVDLEDGFNDVTPDSGG